MSPKHCTSPELLAYLDDELSPHQTLVVRQHLSRCWRCRSRAGDLEDQIRTLTREFTLGSFPNQLQVDNALKQFLRWRSEYDRASSTLKFAFPQRGALRAAFATLASICIVVFAGFTYSRFQPSPERVLARAQSVEQSVTNQTAVHESYELEIIRNFNSVPNPVPNQKSSLEIWSEPSADRFAWRWKDQENRLQFAEWNPGEGEHYFFDGHSSAAVHRVASDRIGSASFIEVLEPLSSLEQLNTAFVGWIKSRRWHVISIAGDFASFSGKHRTSLSVRRIRPSDRPSILVLEAACVKADKEFKLILEVDEASGRPLAEIARVTSPHSSVEFRVLSKKVESVRVIAASREIFQPEIAIPRDSPAMPPVVSRPMPLPVAYRPDSLLNDAEVQVLYTLHRGGFCLGAPITVTRDPSLSLIHLDGLVESNEIRTQIASAVSSLATANLVRVNLKTLQEAAAESAPLKLHTIVTPANSSPSISGSSAVPIEILLDESSLPDEKKAELKKSIAEVSNQFVSATESLSRESWALSRLSRQFSPSQLGDLGLESRHLLAMMANDHLLSLDHTISEIEALTAPFKPVLGPETMPGGGLSIESEKAGNDWDATFSRLLDRSELINSQSQFLFALGGVSQLTPAGSVQQLLQALSGFRQILTEAGIRVKQFNSDPVPLITTSSEQQSAQTKQAAQYRSQVGSHQVSKSTTEVNQ